MKKNLSLMLVAVMAFSFAACGGNPSNGAGEGNTPATAAPTENPATPDATPEPTDEAPETVTVKSLNADRAEIDLEVPYGPERIAVMDLASLDILDNLGMGGRVVGVSKGSSIDYLQDYVTDDAILDLGTIKEASLEAVMACEPDVIFIGGRLAAQYDALSEIAPVVYLAVDAELGVVESTRINATAIASMFGLEEQINGLMADFDGRIATLSEFAAGKTAVIGMVTSGGFNVLGNDARCSIIGVELGFENVGVNAEIDTSTHGNEASFEFLVSVNPDYIFAMDRDAAIGTEGAQLAAEILDNELVNTTNADQNGHIVIMANPNVWYTAEGGITALGIMLSDLESVLLS